MAIDILVEVNARELKSKFWHFAREIMDKIRGVISGCAGCGLYPWIPLNDYINQP